MPCLFCSFLANLQFIRPQFHEKFTKILVSSLLVSIKILSNDIEIVGKGVPPRHHTRELQLQRTEFSLKNKYDITKL